MDKELLERVSIGIQLLGYGLFYYLFFVDEGGAIVRAARRENVFFFIICFIPPLIIRWMLTGKFKILPIMSKQEEEK